MVEIIASVMRVSSVGLWACLLLLQPATTVFAEALRASNSTASSQSISIILVTSVTGMRADIVVEPLTEDAGKGQDVSAMMNLSLTGSLVLITESNANNVNNSQIAYLSCDDDYYAGELSVTDILNFVVSGNPQAILTYSTASVGCVLTDEYADDYSMIYSMASAGTSRLLRSSLTTNNNTASPSSTIQLDPLSIASASASATDSSADGTTSTSGASSNVAMIILYSITGIITAAFLLIIITGAVRAHRHPERYGPRNAHHGQPRQSRAKGIARAMLETLPIVKFGDEPTKQTSENSHDLERGEPDATPNMTQTTQNAPENLISGAVVQADTTNLCTKKEDADSQTPSAAHVENASIESPASTAVDEETLQCSICTDDFVRGQDIRVLPCNHKYHPDCIDPWLLNVSGTCPLCRIDLHPVTSRSSARSGHSVHPGDGARLPPPLGANEEEEEGDGNGGDEENAARPRRQSRLSQLYDMVNPVVHPARLLYDSPQQRIDAARRRSWLHGGVDDPYAEYNARRLREQRQRQHASQAESTEAGSENMHERHRHSVTRFLERFRVSTRRQGEDGVTEEHRGDEWQRQEQSGSAGNDRSSHT